MKKITALNYKFCTKNRHTLAVTCDEDKAVFTWVSKANWFYNTKLHDWHKNTHTPF